jgi:GntR family transcriptional regulator
MRIDTENPVPIFQQIVDRLSAAVAAGVYGEGELVPSVRQMAVNLLVNPNTVQRAYEQLERDG